MSELAEDRRAQAANGELPATSSAADRTPPPASSPIGIAAEHAIVHFDGESPTGPRVGLASMKFLFLFHIAFYSFSFFFFYSIFFDFLASFFLEACPESSAADT